MDEIGEFVHRIVCNQLVFGLWIHEGTQLRGYVDYLNIILLEIRHTDIKTEEEIMLWFC